MSLTRRLQLLLDEERYARVAAIAAEQQRSVASVIRDAIDTATGASSADRSRAWSIIASAEPMDVPDPGGLRAEIDAGHDRGRPT